MDGQLVGRSKHLARLATVFRHRHGTWADFGGFLKDYFERSAQEIPCRHNHRGRHHGILLESQDESDPPVFDHERYSRACVAVGTFDPDKNSGIVVADLCVQAARFLTSIGKGDPEDATGRDRDYNPPPDPPSSSNPSEHTDSYGAVDLANVMAFRNRVSVVDDGGEVSDEDTSYSGDSVFEGEGVLEQLDELAPEPGPESQGGLSVETIEVLSDAGSVDTITDRRSSTKIRAATLGYLRGFADNPVRLRTEFRRLRGDDSLWVLHLCGCGLCIVADGGQRSRGCCEWSHLTLGSSVANAHHRTYHEVMSHTRVEDYPALCGIIRCIAVLTARACSRVSGVSSELRL